MPDQQIRVDSEIHRGAKERTARQGTNLKAVTEALLRSYVDGVFDDFLVGGKFSQKSLELSCGQVLHLTAEQSRWVDTLLYILNSNNRVAVQAVEANLVAFGELIRQGEPSEGPSNSSGTRPPVRRKHGKNAPQT